MITFNLLDTITATDPLCKLRYWMIEKLAGKAVVVLNAEILHTSSVEYIGEIGENGALVCNNVFPVEGIIIRSKDV